MKKIVTLAISAAAVGAVLIMAPLTMAAPRSAEDYARMRQGVMKEFAAHGKAIAAFLKGSKNAKKAKALGTAGDVEFRAMGIAAMADKLPSLFAQKTSLADIPGKTRAKPAIWSDWNKFYAATRRLKSKALELEAAAATGDKAKIDAARKALGKEACAACHKVFRGPKPKKSM